MTEIPNSFDGLSFPNEFAYKRENYKVLSLHLKETKPEERSCMDDVALRYLSCTEKIIKVLDGTDEHRDLMDYDKNAVPLASPDVVIYLDKSARPVSWLVQKFWPDMADKKAVKPRTKFINIDRDDQIWRDIESAEEGDPTSKTYRFDRIPKDKVLALRALFYRGELSESNWKNEVMDDKKSDLANKNILIIDEVKFKGQTMKLAQGILKLAFPNSNVTGVYFWDSQPHAVFVGSGSQCEMQMTSVPAWYDKKDSFGRGVSNKSELYYSGLDHYPSNPDNTVKKPRDIRFKLGSFILSAPHFEPVYKEKFKENGDKITVIDRAKLIRDKKAILLRQDIDRLYQDYVQHRRQ